MKLSVKILGIVAILGLLALSVMGLGLYGISRLGGALDNYMRLADRAEALLEIEGDALQFSIAEKNLLLAKDDASMRAILESEDFKSAVPRILEGIEGVKQSITPTSQAWVREVPEKLTRELQAFSEATNAVAQLTQENTAQRALDEQHVSLPLWDEYLAVAGPAFTAAAKDWDLYRDNAEEMLYVYALRVNRISFQRDIQLVMTARTAEERQAAVDSLRAGVTEFLALLEKAPQVFMGGRNAQFGRQLAGQLNNAGKIRASAEKIIDLAGQDSDGRAFAYSTSVVRDARQAFQAVLSDAIDRSHTQLNGLTAENFALQKKLFWTMLAGSVGGIVFVLCLAWFTVSRLTRQLHGIIEGLDEASVQVAAAADAISESSQSLAEGATEQAASLEETSAALEEMASMTRRNADNAALTNQTTSRTVECVETGAKGVVSMSQAMNEIAESSERISGIIKTIEGIAFQTNLLALNAAVEAARAGEAGMGFAVVADEVRNLAQRSAVAAHDTADLIEATVNRVRHGSGIAMELDTGFKEIEEGAQQVGTLIEEISTATSEQAQGADQVNLAVAQLDKVTQTNAAAAEECASASAELSGQAGSLKTMVGELVALVTGERRQSAGAEETPAGRRAGNGNGVHRGNGNGNGVHRGNGNGNGIHWGNGNGNGIHRGNGNGRPHQLPGFSEAIPMEDAFN